MDLSALVFEGGLLSYLLVPLALATAGTLVPLPEEAILLTLGYLISAGYFSPVPLALLCILGVMVGDSFIFALVRHGGAYAEKLDARFSGSRIRAYVDEDHAHTILTLFFCRFLVGVRFVGPFLAAQSGMPWSRFVFWDFLAALVYVPLVLFLGYHFRHVFVRVLEHSDAIGLLGLGIAIAAVIAASIYFLRSRSHS